MSGQRPPWPLKYRTTRSPGRVCFGRSSKIALRIARSVACSWTRRVSRDVVAGTYMRTQAAARTALQWGTQNAGMDLLASTGVPVLRVRYEDLVVAPRAVLREIAAFAGLPRAGGFAFLYVPPAGCTYQARGQTVGNRRKYLNDSCCQLTSRAIEM